MDTRDKALALFLDALGVSESDLGQFEGRKQFQKAIYLLQQPPFERDFGFHYNLYIKGPYCPALADAGYRLLQNVDGWQQTRRQFELKPECISDIEKLCRVFTRTDDTLDADLLELAATIHFLLNQTFRYVPNDNSRVSHTHSWVQQNKPELAARFDKAIEKLRSLKMLA
jgi:uncharacterized protein YwgA